MAMQLAQAGRACAGTSPAGDDPLGRERPYKRRHGVPRPVFDRFTEGLATPDLRAAKALLDALDQTS